MSEAKSVLKILIQFKFFFDELSAISLRAFPDQWIQKRRLINEGSLVVNAILLIALDRKEF